MKKNGLATAPKSVEQPVQLVSVNATLTFRKMARELAAVENKRLYEILDSVALPALRQRLSKLQSGRGTNPK